MNSLVNILSFMISVPITELYRHQCKYMFEDD